MHIKINVENGENATPSDSSDKKNKVLEECVEEVMRILKSKYER